MRRMDRLDGTHSQIRRMRLAGLPRELQALIRHWRANNRATGPYPATHRLKKPFHLCPAGTLFHLPKRKRVAPHWSYSETARGVSFHKVPGHSFLPRMCAVDRNGFGPINDSQGFLCVFDQLRGKDVAEYMQPIRRRGK